MGGDRPLVRVRWSAAVAALCGLSIAAGGAPAVAEDRAPAAGAEADAPWVIAHRGASAYRPEHTLEAYRVAARMGADIIEPDLVPTKDGHLVVRHENELGGTTDVGDRPEFADRHTTKTIDGRPVTGWFSEDFTLAELRTLRAVERIPDIRPRSARFDGRFQVPTFEEVLDLRETLEQRHGRPIRVIPELKHGAYFDSIGLDLEAATAKALRARDLDGADSPVVLQSFEPPSVAELDGLVDTPIVQLINAAQAELATPEGLDRVAEHADLIGPELKLVLPIGADGRAGEPTSLVEDAHERGLLVTPYTLRSENAHLPDGYDRGDTPSRYGDHRAYYIAMLETGVDGVFSDSPDHLFQARKEFLRKRDA
ncbi:glycerophosphoryl diester phosphodiesterase [Murinocardiopsis flavida]|uniref:glycerophosphodiester phosphodiesterase n=1 Tax=Murinocardiopsis flavida TaxID=645275 RepID=A0A2P8DJ02_9ACTN|nr:glycerophosphodiester phosphodiesterase family protein [Murinocardiopsis flavida]PSK97200.1 glycerophosphoryl diester phosphodiesterase [Murinocardiopsis flavida]